MTITDQMATEYQAFAQALCGADRITALCHENPDADTIGGAVAIALIARRLGKEWEIVSVDAPAPALDFLPLFDAFRQAPALDPDVAVVCDAATLERVGRVRVEHATWLDRAQLVNVDHHVTNSRFGVVNLVDPEAAATCQVIAAALPHLGIELNDEIATALLTGIIRDSHGFSDPSTSGETLRIAADLVEAGAPIALIHRRVLADLPYATLALWGRMLHGIGQRRGGRIIYTTLTQEMLDSTGTENHDADGLAEFIAKAKDADISILLREVGPRQTRVSLRVNEAIDATRIAAVFGGGGHARRAGCTIEAPAAEAVNELLLVCERVLDGTA
ncbi:MAG: DHH family phosphoesterase [Candidatus Limnocylindria bacterium]